MTNFAYDIMSKDLTTVHWSESLYFAEEKMHRLNIRHLPVINDYGKLIGIISDRDIQRGRSTYTDFADPEFLPIVGDFMTAPVEHVDSRTEIQEVAHRMLAFKISAFAVVDQGEIVGLVTTDDMLRFLISILDNQQRPQGDTDHLRYYSPIGEIANFFSQAGI